MKFAFCKSFLSVLIFGSLLGSLTAAEKVFLFGKPPFEEKAVVSQKEEQYIVTCYFKPMKSNFSEEMQKSFNLQRAKGICIKGIASYRKGKTVSHVSGNARGMMEIKEHEIKAGELIYYFQVESFIEKK